MLQFSSKDRGDPECRHFAAGGRTVAVHQRERHGTWQGLSAVSRETRTSGCLDPPFEENRRPVHAA